MKAQIALITILTKDVPTMKNFYKDVLGFEIKSDMDNYVEFESEGARFAICNREIMTQVTGGHPSYQDEKNGQAFELAFPCDSPADVQKTFEEIVSKGATPVKAPSAMPWGQTTAFFADPDGNIHEIFSN
ncbi:VOC family protein [Bacillus luteolus]|uniref:VOC family protein n=1 Tax=Litchfieldia luteola TaxID=682179 RepID=A0ABR9QGS4_9BACI|nr:VOC family protein [Cytobacillus luteolus]MBE4907636.1 VOC family protein [Cytobacillus luteolus]MBP1941087.1 catechol 2,3-dioxygenase-like lactoylglutathione lyase family enzyme [Cytobacillus luteolus]